MTADDITRLTPLIEDLQARGIVATWSTTSWPLLKGTGYSHAFRLRSHGLVEPLVIQQPFGEDDVINRLAAAQARENHSAAIEATYALSKDALLRDLANVYRARLLGKDCPVPSSVTIKDLVVPLIS